MFNTGACVSRTDRALFEAVRSVVRKLSDSDPERGRLSFEFRGQNIDFSSAHLAHAFARLFPVKAVDGNSPGIGSPHSWLKTRDENLIDLMPVGIIGGPILFDTYHHDRWRQNYIPDRTNPAARAGTFRDELRAAECIVRNAMTDCGIAVVERNAVVCGGLAV